MNQSEIKSPAQILANTAILALNKKRITDLRLLPPVVATDAIKEAIKQAVTLTLEESNQARIAGVSILSLEQSILNKLGV